MNLGIICDLTPDSGLGHIKRMRSLYDELVKHSINCIFLFPKTNSNFKKKYTVGLQVKYFELEDQDPEVVYNNLVKSLSISIIVIDSYKQTYALEESFANQHIFTVAIDDHIRNRCSDLVFNNRADIIHTYRNQNVGKNWFVGPEYCLINKVKRRKQVNENKKKKILLHAGGASLFESIKELCKSTLVASIKFNATITAICSDPNAKKFLMELAKNCGSNSSFKIIPFSENLISELSSYDIVVGPAGTTTFEAIAAGTLPLSVPFNNDGRDSINSWYYLGNLMHLDYNSSKDTLILMKSWDLIFAKYSILLKNLEKNSKKVDGLGPERVAKKIITQYRKHIGNLVKFKDKGKKRDERKKAGVKSTACCSGDIRFFLDARNKTSVREMSSNSSHIISWPEHVEWWLNKSINRFSLHLDGNLVAFHWSRIVSDEEGDFIVTGWFPIESSESNLKVSAAVVKAQVEFVSSKYKNKCWIIAMKKKNKFVIMLNKKLGFNLASKRVTVRAINHFNIDDKKFEIMEMQL